MKLLTALLLAAIPYAVNAAPPDSSNDASFETALTELRATAIANKAHNANTVCSSGQQKQCVKVAQNTDAVSNLKTLYDCSEFYWHKQELDNPPYSYNNIIRINRRALALAPADIQTRDYTAWLLWSKWSEWRIKPAKMPDGEGKKEESIKVYEDVLAANQSNLIFYYNYATHIALRVRDYAKGAELYVRTNEIAGNKITKENKRMVISARMNAGHNYRRLGQTDSAIEWYKKALELDPQYWPAIKALNQLGVNAP